MAIFLAVTLIYVLRFTFPIDQLYQFEKAEAKDHLDAKETQNQNQPKNSIGNAAKDTDKFLENVEIAELLNLIPTLNDNFDEKEENHHTVISELLGNDVAESRSTNKQPDASGVVNEALSTGALMEMPSYKYSRARQLRVDHMNKTTGVVNNTLNFEQQSANACLLMHIRKSDQLRNVLPTIDSIEKNFNKRYGYTWVLVHSIDVKIPDDLVKQIMATVSVDAKFIKVSKLVSDSDTLKAFTDGGNNMVTFYDSKEFEAKKTRYYEYLSLLQTTKLNKTSHEVWAKKFRSESRLFDANSIAITNFLAYDIFQLEELSSYDYVARVDPGVVFDCEVAHDIFARLALRPEINAGFTFMDKIQDPQIYKNLTSVMNNISLAISRPISDVFRDKNSREYNGVSIDVNTFSILKTSFFKSKRYRSFFKFINFMKAQYSEIWNENQILSAYLSFFYSETHLSVTIKGYPLVTESGDHHLVAREDLLALTDLGISDMSMVDHDMLENDLASASDLIKYGYTKQSCPLSDSKPEEFNLRQTLECACDLDTRFFYSDLSEAVKVGKDESPNKDEPEASKLFSKLVTFTEFHDLVSAQRQMSLLGDEEKAQLNKFNQYFSSYPDKQSKALQKFNEIQVRIARDKIAAEKKRLEAKKKAEEEAKKKAEEEAKKKAEEEAKKKAEEEAKRKAEEEARKKAEEEAKKKAEEEAKKKDEEEAKKKDEEEAKKKDEGETEGDETEEVINLVE